MATWIKIGNFSRSVGEYGFLIVIMLLYELLVGFVILCINPLLGFALAILPLLFFIFITKPLLAYGVFILSMQFSGVALTRIGFFNLRIVDIGFFTFLSVVIIYTLINKEKLFVKTGIDEFLWIFLFWIILSFLWSHSKIVAIEALLKIFIGVITFYITVQVVSNKSFLTWAINIWILAGLISALAAINEFLSTAIPHILPVPMGKWGAPIRSVAFYGGPIMMGYFLTLAVFINYIQILNAQSLIKKTFYTIICAIIITGVLTSLSRNDIAALALGTLFFNYRFKEIRPFTILGCILIVLIGFLLTHGKLFFVVWDRLIYVLQGLEISSPHRVDIWTIALQTILEHPLLGVGVGGFPAVAAEKFGAELWKGGLSYPHSLILYILVELGVIGFCFVICLVLKIFKFIRMIEDKIDNHFDKVIATGFTAGLLVHLFWALAQNITFQQIIFWSFLGIAFATYNIFGKIYGVLNGSN